MSIRSWQVSDRSNGTMTAEPLRIIRKRPYTATSTRAKSFFVYEPDKQVLPGLPHARRQLPDHIDRVYGEVYVLGPVLIVAVFTFVLEVGEERQLERLLTEDAESLVTILGPREFSPHSVRDVKKQRLRDRRNAVTVRCQDWVTEVLPGHLSAVTEGLGQPTTVLLSLKDGKPFSTHSTYMALLDLVNTALAQQFDDPSYLYLTNPIDMEPNNRSTAVFNEGVAAGPGAGVDPDASPEIVHEKLSPLMVADALWAALSSFDPRMRDTRMAMVRLDLASVSDATLFALSTSLLESSTDLAAIATDVGLLAENAALIWLDMPNLNALQPAPGWIAEPTGTIKKRFLLAKVEAIVTEEQKLRELLQTMVGTKRDETNISLQKSLGRYTKVLIALTVVLVIAAGITIGVQLS
jgi:hypothetical protein